MTPICKSGPTIDQDWVNILPGAPSFGYRFAQCHAATGQRRYSNDGATWSHIEDIVAPPQPKPVERALAKGWKNCVELERKFFCDLGCRPDLVEIGAEGVVKRTAGRASQWACPPCAEAAGAFAVEPVEASTCVDPEYCARKNLGPLCHGDCHRKVEAKATACKAPEWCGKKYLADGVPVAKSEAPECSSSIDMVLVGQYGFGRVAYCSQSCADAKRAAYAEATPQIASPVLSGPGADAVSVPSPRTEGERRGTIQREPWKAGRDELRTQRQINGTPYTHEAISIVARLPILPPVGFRDVEQNHEQHRPRWRGPLADSFRKRWP